MEQCGTGVEYIPSCHIRKEAKAHEQQMKSGITSGLIGTLSCLESCSTFKAVYDKTASFPQIRPVLSRCKQLYFYYDHEDYGFMSVRLQTWVPYEVQIAMNGREWLRRSLSKEGIPYVLQGNRFLDIADYKAAQYLLNSQLDTRWVETLSGFMPAVFPSMKELLGNEMSYTWTLWQSEWARDSIFHNPKVLSVQMNRMLRHAFISGTSDRVLRYMGHPIQKNGQPHWSSDPELISRVALWHDGARIRHWMDKNSLKLYNEQNVLRFEFTMNNPSRFRIHRTVEGSDSKKFLPMRKGIAGINVRTQICSARINNFTEQVATLEENISVEELISRVTQPITSDGKRYRGLNVTGKDLPFGNTIQRGVVLSLLKRGGVCTFEQGGYTYSPVVPLSSYDAITASRAVDTMAEGASDDCDVVALEEKGYTTVMLGYYIYCRSFAGRFDWPSSS